MKTCDVSNGKELEAIIPLNMHGQCAFGSSQIGFNEYNSHDGALQRSQMTVSVLYSYKDALNHNSVTHTHKKVYSLC